MSTIITIKNGQYAGDYRTNFKGFNQRILTYKENGQVDTFESIKTADFAPILEAYEAEQKAAQASETPEAPAQETPETSAQETTKKERKHPTADAFLKDIPETYIFRTNNKGHILISKAKEDKTAYARIRPLKDGAYIFPGKELKATREDWEFHEGWANEYALKVSNWDEVATVLGF